MTMIKDNELNKSQKESKEILSQEEKINFLKAMFSTLDVDKKAIFTQWCHEEVEKGAGALLGDKMKNMETQMNSFIAKASDRVIKTGAKVYNSTNEAFSFVFQEDEEVSKEIQNKGEKDSTSASFFD